MTLHSLRGEDSFGRKERGKAELKTISFLLFPEPLINEIASLYFLPSIKGRRSSHFPSEARCLKDPTHPTAPPYPGGRKAKKRHPSFPIDLPRGGRG